ncbi:hypothetical protein Acr_00g0042540 [Actinidia rufa]|uniref:Retrovirus-related Pol polyprotein from transposon TNT 1-94-like beta-barrel domain-containing protein n=1 Tax=Actinidia rufa TaxID=165716 RepID=A0A7J0DIB4_9ERIC|nr:hypothetical protein Acr_00g0042540 [Actinidia rufa]
MSEVLGLNHAHKAWTTLEAFFSHRSKTRELQLKDEFQLMHRGSKFVSDFSRLFKGICHQLADIGHPIDDLDKVHWFLRVLGPDYKIFSTTMLSQLLLPSFADIVPKALSHEIFERSLSQQSTTLAFYAQQNCFTRSKTPRKGSQNSANLAEAFAARSILDSNNSDWYPDSSATSHMTHDPEGVDVPVVYSGNERVMVGNGQSLPISHIGSVSTLIPKSSLLLSNVLVVPGIKKNLISISQLTKDNNYCVTFSPSGFTIQVWVTRVVLGVGKCENGLDGLGESFPRTSPTVSPVPPPSLPTLPVSIPTTSTNTHSMVTRGKAGLACSQRASGVAKFPEWHCHHGLQLHHTSSHELLAYSDADWAGCLDTHRFTTGYVIFLGVNLVSWCSKKHSTISRSNVEAEYRSLAVATAEVAWIIQLLRDLRLQMSSPLKILCNNKSAILMAVNPFTQTRSKHIAIDYHFVHELLPVVL